MSQTLGYLEGENSFYTENATGRVGSLTSKVGTTTTGYAFTYDDRGNITAIRVDGVLKYSYEYDNLNQLVRENNAVANKTYVYTYDDAGNILTKKTYAYTTGTLGSVQSTYSYTYGNSQWGDQLTAYRGTTITYDSLGNPLSYYNGTSYTLSWTKGRWLTTMKKGSADTVSYQYNADGIRIGKVSSEKTVTYVLSGSRIVAEKNGSNIIRYLYDAQGLPVGMILNSTVYLYEKNLQGDIVGIYTTGGTRVASYTYDAWGKLVSSSYTDYTVFSLNPFRYRGYYYDTESGFYYLQSRYYDPTTCRFISADGYVNANGDLQGFNMYAYCSNNPVMYVDYTGDSILPWIELLYFGEIHFAVQNHLKTNYGFETEIRLDGGKMRIDLMKDGGIYELKPCSYLTDYRLLIALGQLMNYYEASNGDYHLGDKTFKGSFMHRNLHVSYWTVGYGIILYSFRKIKTEKKPKETQSSKEKHGSVNNPLLQVGASFAFAFAPTAISFYRERFAGKQYYSMGTCYGLK